MIEVCGVQQVRFSHSLQKHNHTWGRYDDDDAEHFSVRFMLFMAGVQFNSRLLHQIK